MASTLTSNRDLETIVDAQFRQVMDLMPAAVYVCEAPSGMIRYYNRAATLMWGREPLIGQPADVFCGSHRLYCGDGSYVAHADCPMALVLRGAPAVRNREIIIERPDRSRATALVSIDPLTDGHGQIIGAINVFQDVTEQRQLYDQLSESEARNRHLIASIAAAVYTTDAEGRITMFNARAAELWGREPVIGQDLWCGSWRILHANGTVMPHEECPMAMALREGRPVVGREILVERPDGSRAWVLVHPVPIRDSSERIVGAVNMLVDITDRKRDEAILSEHIEELEKLMEVMPIPVWIARDPQCRDIAANRAGYEIVRMPYGSKLSPATLANSAASRFSVLQDGRALQPDEFPMYRAITEGRELRDLSVDLAFDDGHVVSIYGAVIPLLSANGKVRGCMAAFMEVTEFRRLDRSLRETIRELAEGDQRKNEFLATLAHELRNPMAPIRSGVELLRITRDDSDSAEQVLTMMERQVRQMVRLIDDLLEISRITQGKLELKRSLVALQAVVETAVEASRPIVDAKRHALTVTLPPQPLTLFADQARLSQVVANLLNNAAKYTPLGGQIDLTVEQDVSDAVITVSDTGRGIPQDKLEHVFQMFAQVAESLEQRQEGLGIGLTLVRKLVDMHGGTVYACSNGPGQGSQFVVRLPIESSAPAARGDSKHGEPSISSCRQQKRLLVVDDNHDAGNSLALMLKHYGFETRVARDGQQALQAAEEFRPDVVLLDIGMPGLSGNEVAKRLRQEPWGKSMLLIAQTGWGQERDRALTTAAGFDHHLVKPIESAAVLRLIEEHVSAPA